MLAITTLAFDIAALEIFLPLACGAYIIPAAGSVIPLSEMRLLLRETLPAYMIPAALVSVASFPLTPSGKLDRKALPPPDMTAQEAEVASLEPGTPTEEVVAQIWCEMLDLKQVGVSDNFFELGGHSLLAVRIIVRINETLGAKLDVVDMFRIPTIGALAAWIERNRQYESARPQVVSLRAGHTGLPLYFIGAGQLQYFIARSIGGDRAIYAIEPPIPAEWRHAISVADAAALPNMEQLAAPYADALHAHARSSACVVVGYSFAGLIAFEAAHALQRAGGNVVVVLLIDAFAWINVPGMRYWVWRSLRWIWGGPESGSTHDTSLRRFCARLGNSWRLPCWLLAQMPGVVKRGIAPTDWKLQLYRVVRKSFQPRPLDASGVLFRTTGKDALPGWDTTNGWRDLFTRCLEVIPVEGDHLSMVQDVAHVTALARQINEALERHGLGERKGNGHAR